MEKIKDYSLYLVTSQEHSNGRDTLEIAASAIKGGINIIQMREKHLPREGLMMLGSKLSFLCRENNVTFIVNDDPYLAKDLDADGVHLGQGDIKKYPLREIRNTIGGDKSIGISTHSLSQFKEANDSDYDYVAFGPIFPTPTKDYCIGTDDVGKVLNIANKPVVFIGGISLDNVDIVLSRGAKNIAAIRAFSQASDIEAAVGDFRKIIDCYKGVNNDCKH